MIITAQPTLDQLLNRAERFQEMIKTTSTGLVLDLVESRIDSMDAPKFITDPLSVALLVRRTELMCMRYPESEEA